MSAHRPDEDRLSRVVDEVARVLAIVRDALLILFMLAAIVLGFMAVKTLDEARQDASWGAMG